MNSLEEMKKWREKVCLYLYMVMENCMELQQLPENVPNIKDWFIKKICLKFKVQRKQWIKHGSSSKIQSNVFCPNNECINIKKINIIYHVQIGLYSRVVTYFLRYLCVALNTMTPSLIERAYKWLSITWFGSGRSVGSHYTQNYLFKKKKNIILYKYK